MIHLDKEHLAVMMEAGYVFMGMSRFQEAKEVFEGVACIRPESEVPIVALGGVAFCQGKLKEAIGWYEKALKMVPDSLYGKAYLGETLFFSGDKSGAVQFLKEVDAKDSKGAIGDFARALLDAIHKGFTPEKISQKDEIKKHDEKKRQRV